MRTFTPSRRNPSALYTGASTGAVTGAVVGSSSSSGDGHTDPNGFLGLNWRSIGVSVFVAVITAVATDIALTEWHGYRRRKKGLD